MKKILFNLDEKANGQCLIMLIYRHPKGRFKYSIAEHTVRSHWHPKKYRVREGQQNPAGKRINSELNRAERTLNEILTDFNKKDIVPDNEMIKNEMDVRFKGQPRNPGKINHILSYVDLFINEMKDRRKVSTVKTYTTARIT